MTQLEKRCGYVALIGRPNVGKSTLLNRILGQKVSITSRKPQTTRHRILGIKTENEIQIIYVDTPGLHHAIKNALNRRMNRAAMSAIKDVDVIIFLLEAGRWHTEDELIVQRLKKINVPIIAVLNKIDLVKDKEQLLPYMDQIQHQLPFKAIVPISAKTGKQVKELEAEIIPFLPVHPWFFPKEQLTDKSDRFLIAEIVREQLMRRLGAELPYHLTTLTESFKEEANLLRISVIIYVNKSSQKAIVVGKKGDLLKKVGTGARLAIEKLLGKKVFLQLWVKIKLHWTDDPKLMDEFGL